MGVLLGLALLACGPNAIAQFPYKGDSWDRCIECHPQEHLSYSQHGHPWIEVATGGREPGADLFGFASVGKTLPDPAAYKKQITDQNGQKIDVPMTWADVAAILGNFGEETPTLIRASDGKRVSAGGSSAGSTYTPRCFRCHNPTGYVADTSLKMYGINAWTGGAPATDENGNRMNGVQCEHCHGPSWMMNKPDGLVCRDCHSRTDPDPFTIPDPNFDKNRRIPFLPTADGKTGVFTNHHPQGDEFRRSPHKDIADSEGRHLGCILCHDPHKSVWKDQGGVKFAEQTGGVGNMCTQCHNKRVRGSMGEIGLECVECHMPHKSGGSASPTNSSVAAGPHGHRATHIFKINATNLTAAQNVTAGYWKSPGPDPTDPTQTIDWALDGDAFLTLDMVCADCHELMTIDQMAGYAKLIHRQPGLVDVAVNQRDTLQVVGKNSQVSVDFSIDAGGKTDKAVWWVICQGPKGWSSWNGKKWVNGLRPWKKGKPLQNVEQNVLKAKLPPGNYTYWVCIYPTDGSEHFDSVPVLVKKR